MILGHCDLLQDNLVQVLKGERQRPSAWSRLRHTPSPCPRSLRAATTTRLWLIGLRPQPPSLMARWGGFLGINGKRRVNFIRFGERKRKKIYIYVGHFSNPKASNGRLICKNGKASETFTLTRNGFGSSVEKDKGGPDAFWNNMIKPSWESNPSCRSFMKMN